MTYRTVEEDVPLNEFYVREYVPSEELPSEWVEYFKLQLRAVNVPKQAFRPPQGSEHLHRKILYTNYTQLENIFERWEEEIEVEGESCAIFDGVRQGYVDCKYSEHWSYIRQAFAGLDDSEFNAVFPNRFESPKKSENFVRLVYRVTWCIYNTVPYVWAFMPEELRTRYAQPRTLWTLLSMLKLFVDEHEVLEISELLDRAFSRDNYGMDKLDNYQRSEKTERSLNTGSRMMKLFQKNSELALDVYCYRSMKELELSLAGSGIDFQGIWDENSFKRNLCNGGNGSEVITEISEKIKKARESIDQETLNVVIKKNTNTKFSKDLTNLIISKLRCNVALNHYDIRYLTQHRGPIKQQFITQYPKEDLPLRLRKKNNAAIETALSSTPKPDLFQGIIPEQN